MRPDDYTCPSLPDRHTNPCRSLLKTGKNMGYIYDSGGLGQSPLPTCTGGTRGAAHASVDIFGDLAPSQSSSAERISPIVLPFTFEKMSFTLLDAHLADGRYALRPLSPAIFRDLSCPSKPTQNKRALGRYCPKTYDKSLKRRSHTSGR